VSDAPARTRRWIWLHTKDNVAVALADLNEGETVPLSPTPVVLKERIESGHKFAVIDIPQDTPIIKYEEIIGVAVRDIRVGEHVHVHNVKSLRARSR
jgi:hypothetical protein